MNHPIKPFTQILALCCLTLPLIACATLSRLSSTPTPEATVSAGDVTAPEMAAYNPAADPAADLQRAIGIAQKQHKRILIEVGGEWCIWCHIMDKFYQDHPALLKLREDHYVLLKVNYSEENQNAVFLSQYPSIPGFPHIFILESDGTFLHSQDTSELEDGQSYHLERFTSFLQTWAKP